MCIIEFWSFIRAVTVGQVRQVLSVTPGVANNGLGVAFVDLGLIDSCSNHLRNQHRRCHQQSQQEHV